ncbi:MAG: hypothetical protein AB1798_22560 [Spirochaetota bacterium]
MRYHEPFILLPRKAGRKTIWYYRVWLAEGQRSTARSTGQTSKSAAKAYCRELERRGELIPKKDKPARPKPMTFGDLALDFWTWGTSEYIKTRLRFSDPKQPAISERYCHDMSRIVDLYLLPTWKRRHLESITPQEIESFALRLRDNNGLSGKRVNNIISCFRLMLGEARRAGLITWDPREKGIIRALGNAPKRRGRLTVEEVLKLFANENIETAWKGHLLYRAVNLTAAAPGARQGELLALRDQDVHDDYLLIKHSYSHGYGLLPTKTRRARHVLSLPVYVRRLSRSWVQAVISSQ